MPQPIRVAFTMIGSQNWTGGYNYLLNLLTVLENHEQDRITPVLFLSDSVSKKIITDFSTHTCTEIIRTPELDRVQKGISIVQAVLLGRNTWLYQLFKKYDIDVVFETAQFYGWRFGIPCISWIPDFQHRILPNLFSRKGWMKREIGFRMQVASGRTIMLSSDDARKSCETYYPSSIDQTKTVRFFVPSNTNKYLFSTARSIAESYSLPEKFFFLPNQFWRHKNHEIVIDALSILKKRNKNIVIAASGKQLDPRAPEYFPALQEKIQQLGLEQQLRLLGMIPYFHLRSLMLVCTALLNPSLFEGWSTTVEEARSMGIPMLLSNLEVHHEQMGEKAKYFDRHNPLSLADQLENFPTFDQGEREIQFNEAGALASTLTKSYAQNFVELVQHTANNHHT